MYKVIVRYFVLGDVQYVLNILPASLSKRESYRGTYRVQPLYLFDTRLSYSSRINYRIF